jgi:hypothetical protein
MTTTTYRVYPATDRVTERLVWVVVDPAGNIRASHTSHDVATESARAIARNDQLTHAA